MNIVYLISSFKKTGPVNVTLDLVRQLSDFGNRITIISLSDDFKADSSILKKNNVYYLKSQHRKINQNLIDEVSKIVFKENAELVHSHGIRADYVNFKLKGNIIKVSTSHNNPFIDYVYSYGVVGFFMAIFQIYIFSNLNSVVALTPNQKKLLDFFLRKKNVFLIPNGVRRIKSKLSFSKESPILKIGLVASLVPRKNAEFVIRNFYEGSYRNLSLEIYGEGNLLAKFKRLYKSDNIIFHGFVGNKASIFQNIDLLISMSKSEGLPLNVLEAIGADVPIVVSNIPSHAFICSKLPKGSFLILKNNSKIKMKDTLSLFNEKKIHFKSYASAFSESFSDYTMAKRYLNLYAKLLVHRK